MPGGTLSELRLIRSFSISFPMVTYSCGSTTNPACCDWKKFITSSRARAASSCEGVMGEESVEEPLSSLLELGSGGGCMECTTWVGDTAMASSIAARDPGISVMGESRAPLLMNFGVSASEEPGGDMYCSTPTSIGNVWLRGRWKLLLPGCPVAACRPMKGLGPHAESGVKKGEESEVGLVGPAEKEDGAVSVNTLDNDVLLCE